MKLSLVGIVGFLAVQSVASPGKDRCDSYEYKNVCSHCPHRPHHPRELEDRDGGHHDKHKVCYKDCPREWQECKVYSDKRSDDDYEHPGYMLDYSQDFSCPRDFKFKVVVKIEEQSGEKYLKVHQNYQGGDKDKRGSISSSSLGVYKSYGSTYKPKDLNYNNYCHGDECSVPVKNLPGYPELCDTEIYLAVGNGQCYDRYGRDDNGYHQATKYVKVTVRCDKKNHKNRHCREYCCCPH